MLGRLLVGLTANVALISSPALAGKTPKAISDAPLISAERYQPLVEAQLKTILLDPESARYDWREPYQVTCRKGVYNTPQRWRGWAVDVYVNAKNTFGGYTGPQQYTVMLTNDGTEDKFELLDGSIFWMFRSCKREPWQASDPQDK